MGLKENIQQQLQEAKKVSIDTNIFIYLSQRNPRYLEQARGIFQYLEKRKTPITLTTLLLTELLVYPFKQGKDELAQKWRSYLEESKTIELIPTNTQIATRAARLRANYNFKTPDSIHLATAVETDCDLFIGNDKSLKKIKEIKTLCLSEFKL
jgi:predicted nucleic acid-binding protein